VKVLSIYSIKGGVGKTATAVNLAHLTVCSGARTLLWDLDPQAAASFYFRIEPRVKGGGGRLLRRRRGLERAIRETDYPGLDLVPGDFSYRYLDLELAGRKKPLRRIRRLLERLRDDYDVVLIDCAPSVSLVSEAVLAASDLVLVPTIPTPLSLRTLTQLQRLTSDGDAGGPPLLPFFSMVDRRKSLHRTLVERNGGIGAGFAAAEIPYASEIERMGVERGPVTARAPSSPSARAFTELWREAMTAVGFPGGAPPG
jgi:cellulose biosynthesis protein BcsQ